MKILSHIILSVALTAPLAITTAAHADDKASATTSKRDMTVDQLPGPVKSTVQRETKNKTIESIRKSSDSGAGAYEVVFLDGNKETTLAVATSGKIVSRQVRAVDSPSSANQPSAPNTNQPSAPNQDSSSQDRPSQDRPTPVQPNPSRHGATSDHPGDVKADSPDR